MPSDLTERLAAKLAKDGLMFTEPIDNTPAMRLSEAPRWLPLLLSEPELVASLPDEVRRNLLRTLLLGHPDAVEDNGRVTISTPHDIGYQADVSVKYLANWLAPEGKDASR